MNWRPTEWEIIEALILDSWVTRRPGEINFTKLINASADAILLKLMNYADGKWIRLDTDKDGNIVVFLEADREV